MSTLSQVHNDYYDPDKYGLFDEQEDNSIVEEAFKDYDGPYSLYRACYKYTDCGPSIGFKVRYWEPADDFDSGPNSMPYDKEVSRWVYCDDLYVLGSWKDLQEKGILIDAISVSSIVEGSDAEVPAIEIDCSVQELEKHLKDSEDSLSACLDRLFYKALDSVNAEACALWDEANNDE